jgi:MFS superfamily sulfate permease-like transporter
MNVGRDALASVVVFLIALPLCMGIAIASGQPPAAGIVTGIIGGLVVGLLAGCPLQVSGPAAGLSVIVFELAMKHGVVVLAVVTVLAGLIQLLAGVLRVGQWFRAVPPAVIHGMLAGIGILIFASQFHVMVDDKPQGSGLTNLLTIPSAIWKAIAPGDATHHLAAGIGIVTLVVVVGWGYVPRRLRGIPAPLAGVLTASVVAACFGLPIRYVEVPESLLGALRVLPADGFSKLLDPAVWVMGLAMAIVASAETLLSAGAVDRLHDGPRTNYDRELIAQGVGNTLSGLVGGLPMTGVIVRSKTNVDAGATSRLSAVLHGVWLLAAVALFPQVLRLVPICSLAALLVYTGVKLVNKDHIKALAAHARVELAIYSATVLGIVALDLLKGVMIGLALAAARLLWTFSHLGVTLERHGPVDVLRLEGVATFLLLPRLASSLDEVPPSHRLRIDASQLDYIDHACIELIEEWIKQREKAGGAVEVDHVQLKAIQHGHKRYAEMRRTAVGL